MVTIADADMGGLLPFASKEPPGVLSWTPKRLVEENIAESRDTLPPDNIADCIIVEADSHSKANGFDSNVSVGRSLYTRCG